MSHCCSGCSLAVKANADRRDHIPKQRHRATSSVAYDAPLRQRGSLSAWCIEKAIAALKRGATDYGRRTVSLLRISERQGVHAASRIPSLCNTTTAYDRPAGPPRSDPVSEAEKAAVSAGHLTQWPASPLRQASR
jgi:hypothetical protein